MIEVKLGIVEIYINCLNLYLTHHLKEAPKIFKLEVFHYKSCTKTVQAVTRPKGQIRKKYQSLLRLVRFPNPLDSRSGLGERSPKKEVF